MKVKWLLAFRLNNRVILIEVMIGVVDSRLPDYCVKRVKWKCLCFNNCLFVYGQRLCRSRQKKSAFHRKRLACKKFGNYFFKLYCHILLWLQFFIWTICLHWISVICDVVSFDAVRVSIWWLLICWLFCCAGNWFVTWVAARVWNGMKQVVK